MFKCKRIRSSLTVATFFLIALILIASSIIANHAFSSALTRTTKSELEAKATYLATLINEQESGYEQSLLAYGNSTATRITLIDAQGIVQFDSVFPIETLDNHLFRKEVQEALQEGMASSKRQSSTENLPVIYVAFRLDTVENYSILRVSRTLKQIDVYHNMYRSLFIPAAIVLLLLSFAIMALVINTLTKPLIAIKEQAKSYGQGDWKTKACSTGPIELQELSLIMQQMAMQVDFQFKQEQYARKQLKTLLNSLDEGILLLDGQLTITVANQKARLMLQEDSLVGKKLVQVIPKEEVLSMCRKTMKEGSIESTTMEHYGHHFGQTAALAGKTDTQILQFQSCAVYSDDQTIQQVVLSLHDRTEHRRLENMRKEFVANVSHELKTPITSIAGFSQALLQTKKEEEIAQFCSIIHKQALNMQRIVEDLLLLSSLDQQTLTHQRNFIDPLQLMQQSSAACSYKFTEQKRVLLTSLENPHDLQVYVNAMLIVQALTNLLSNALAYSERDKPVEFLLRVTKTELICTVKDQGIGIPLEAQQRIFERFYRVDTARSRSQGGTGLGLSIVKHIASVHQGKVEVTSVVGKGSTFTLTIPLGDTYLSEMKNLSDTLYKTSGLERLVLE